MSNSAQQGQAELTAQAIKDPLKYRNEVEGYLQKRRISDLLDRVAKQETIDHSMKAVQSRVAKRLENKSSHTPEDVLFETLEQFANKPSLAAPVEAKAYESDLQNIDIRDLLAILFSKKGERPLSLDAAAEKEGDLPTGFARFLRQERYAELVHGPAETGSVAQRVDAARNSEFGETLFSTKGALKTGRYALMASIIVGTGGAAIPGMVGMRVAKQVAPQIKDSLSSVKGRVEKWLVDNKVISQEDLDKANERSKSKFNSFMSTRTGKTLSIVGGIAACAGMATLLNDAAGLDGVIERVSSLWEGDPSSPAAAAPEVTADAEISQASADLSAVDSESSLDAAPLEASIAHPDGGFSAAGLLGATEGLEGETVEAFRLALADMPSQMSERDLSDAISEVIPSAHQLSIGTLIAQAGELGLDVEQLREGFSNPIAGDPLEQQRAMAGTVFDRSGNAGFVPPNMFDTPPPNLLNGSAPSAFFNSAPAFTPPTLDVASVDTVAESSYQTPNPATAGVGEEVAPSVESPEMPAVSDPISLDNSIEVHPGDTLSDLVWDQYAAAGKTLSAADLYAPGPLTDHPGGVVGMIAEQNGIANPDKIHPGDTIQFGAADQAPANEIQSDAERVDSPPSMIAQPGVNVEAPSVATSPLDQLLEEGVARMQAAQMSERLAEQSPYNVHDIVANRLAEASQQPVAGEPPASLASAAPAHDFPALEGYQPQMPEISTLAEVHGLNPESPSDTFQGTASEVAAAQAQETEVEEEVDHTIYTAGYSPTL